MKNIRIFTGKVITIFTSCVAKALKESDDGIISEIRNIFRNSTFTISTHILNLFGNFLIVVIIARFLGTSALGQYAISTSLAGIVFSFVNFGIQSILTREVATNNKNALKYLANSLGIRVFISLPAGIIITYIIALLLGFQEETLIIILIASVYVGMSGIVGLFYCLFQAIGRFENQFYIILFYKVSSIIGCYSLLYYNFTITSILILFLCLQIIACIISIWMIILKICPVKIHFNFKFWKSYIKESFPLSLAGVAEFVNLKSDAVILGAIKDEQSTGIYNGAYNIYLGVIAFPYAIITAFYPNFSRVYSVSKDQAKRLLKNMFIIITVISCVLALILILFSNSIVIMIYGKDFSISAMPLLILAIGLPFIILNRLNNYVLTAMGMQKWIFYIILLGGIFNIVSNIILIPRYSYIGASITTVITECLILIAGFVKIKSSFTKMKI